MGVEHVLLLEQKSCVARSFSIFLLIFVMNCLIFILQLVILSHFWFLVPAQPYGSAYFTSFTFFVYFLVVIPVGINTVPSSWNERQVLFPQVIVSSSHSQVSVQVQVSVSSLSVLL